MKQTSHDRKNRLGIILMLCLTPFFLVGQSPHSHLLVVRQSEDGSGVLSKDGTQFGFFMPETAGYLFTGLIKGEQSLWLHEADSIRLIPLRKGWQVKITDSLLGRGELELSVLPLSDCNGLIMKVEGKKLPEECDFFWAYGGCSGKRDSTEKVVFFQPWQCRNNVFSREINAFTVYYSQEGRLKVMMGVAPFDTQTRLSSAYQMETPLSFWNSDKKTDAPALTAINPLKSGVAYYYCIYRQNEQADYNYDRLPALFAREWNNQNQPTYERQEKSHPHSGFGPDFHF